MPALELGNEINPSVVATGDFTGDGRTDLAIASQSPNSVVIELNQGNGQFAQPGSVGLVPHDTPLVADLNGDGVPDVAIVDGAGDILYRQGVPGQPGNLRPPVTVNPRQIRRATSPTSPLRYGPVLATVDARDNAVVDARDNAISLYAYRNGGFKLVGSIPHPVVLPVAGADHLGRPERRRLERPGRPQRRRRHPHGLFQQRFRERCDRQRPLPVLGDSAGRPRRLGRRRWSISTGSGRPDIVVTNKLTGQVERPAQPGRRELRPARALSRRGGLYRVSRPTSTARRPSPAWRRRLGVAAGPFTTGAPTDLLTVNTGSNTLGLLAGLGGGRFANPVDIPTAEPAQVVRVADFNHDGIPDIAVLGNDSVSIYLGNGQGGFSAPTSTTPASTQPG